MKLFLACFYAYAFMTHSFYDCNLRAYLMTVDLEPVVDTAKDIYDQGKKFYVQQEWSEEYLYDSLDPKIHFHAKAIAKETYEHGYFYASSLTENSTAFYCFSKEFEQVSNQTPF